MHISGREEREEREREIKKKCREKGEGGGGLDAGAHGAYMSQKKLRQMRYNNKHR